MSIREIRICYDTVFSPDPLSGLFGKPLSNIVLKVFDMINIRVCNGSGAIKEEPPLDLHQMVVWNGGAEGNRTPVRKQLGKNFSGRSLLFTFPHPGGNKHPTGISSFMMRGMGKAYHTHGLHSNHTRARLVDLPGRMGA